MLSQIFLNITGNDLLVIYVRLKTAFCHLRVNLGFPVVLGLIYGCFLFVKIYRYSGDCSVCLMLNRTRLLNIVVHYSVV